MRGPKTAFLQVSDKKKPHSIPFQFEKCKSSQQLTGNVRYLPGLSFDDDSYRQCLWLPLITYVSVLVSLQYFQSCKDFCSGSITLDYLLNLETV